MSKRQKKIKKINFKTSKKTGGRKRGRPKKVSSSQFAVHGFKKRKRGRPKKIKSEKLKAKSLKKDFIKKRGGGTVLDKKIEEGTPEEKISALIARGKIKGFITYNEILKYFPTIEDDIAFLDELYGHLEEVGIDVLESAELLDISGFKKEEDIEKLGRRLGTADSVQLYLKEIGKTPLISAKEEKELAKRIEEGDESARLKLAEANLRLVVSIAKRYIGRSSNLSFLD